MLNIAKEIGIKDVEPVSVIRLGSKVSPKGRLIRVQIGSLSIKRALLSNAKKLKNHQSAQLKDVYITPDLSVQERKIQKELRAELKRRKDNGESNLKIYRGKIVKVNTESDTSMAVDPITTSEPDNNTNR